jgi:hypothetical protein
MIRICTLTLIYNKGMMYYRSSYFYRSYSPCLDNES